MSENQNKTVIKAAQPSATKRSLVYTVAYPIAKLLLSTFLPVKYHNAERLDIEAPFILMGNHQSMMDPVIAAMPVKRYQIRYIGKKELWKVPIVAAIFNSMHMIPVDRHNTDMEAMRACMRVTREGGVLGIFPEGTRHKNGLMEDLESGVAMIALRSKVPLIPVYITGKVRLFRRLHVYVGEPIVMDDLREMGINTETCGLLLGRITQTYAALKEAHPEA
ncbi:MAG: 1-acyl-sn-glycerol-3-phosphate acyltransferase [Clostridia bacterium]|nr:1-acyl-sn-glycerol-3-phosphate acyltransferase [Clostridia bacterium]